MVEVLRFSVSAMDLADEPGDNTLRQLQELETALEDLEARAVALLTAQGHSWEAMAQQLGVARQSLHRRLARRSLRFSLRAETTEGRGLRAEWDRLMARLSDKVDELRDAGPSRSVGRRE